MQRYVASRPMFMDSDIMNLNARTVPSEFGPGGRQILPRVFKLFKKKLQVTWWREELLGI